jgi:arylsulfatase A-like enzyme
VGDRMGSILHRSDATLGQLFAGNGYRTGLFGKWHLGDNYPYRPMDRGYGRVVAHHGGGVGNSADFWGNNYFDDTYFANSQPRKYDGYCTDVWFDQAMRFIGEPSDQPFFTLVATNAPHDPYLIDEKYAAPYASNPDIPHPNFYGMITNIDENFGAMIAFLKEREMLDDTIVIFMTDNGSTGSAEMDGDGFATCGYNAGLRGKKSSYYEGGHKVPFFIRWANGSWQHGRECNGMALDIDMLPTLIDVCGLENTAPQTFDGKSFKSLLEDVDSEWPERTHFLNILQSDDPPIKEQGCVLRGPWRLVHGAELYNVSDDPEQRNDVAAVYPEKVAELQAALDSHWEAVAPERIPPCDLYLGDPMENPTTICSHDVTGDMAWQQMQVIEAHRSSGTWNVEFASAGRYRFEVRRWPSELPLSADAMVSEDCAASVPYSSPQRKRQTVHPASASLTVWNQTHTQPYEPTHESVIFELDIPQAGSTTLQSRFTLDDETTLGAYYVRVTRLVM